MKDVVNSCSEEESADWVACDSESCSGTGGVLAWNIIMLQYVEEWYCTSCMNAQKVTHYQVFN